MDQLNRSNSLCWNRTLRQRVIFDCRAVSATHARRIRYICRRRRAYHGRYSVLSRVRRSQLLDPRWGVNPRQSLRRQLLWPDEFFAHRHESLGGAWAKADLAGARRQDRVFDNLLHVGPVGAGFFRLRYAVAYFYSEDGLRTGIAVFVTSFLRIIIPFSATISALLRREMAFDVLAWCNLAAVFIMPATSIVLAALGWSYLSVLIGSVIGQAALVVLLITVCRYGLRVFVPCLDGWRDVIGFGAYSSAVAIINVVHDAAPQLILGRILDFTAVGLYSRAAGAAQLSDRIYSLGL
jgi:hypothetical protein